MSKKIIAFQMPKTSAASAPALEDQAPEEAGLDEWVHRHETVADVAAADEEARASYVTIPISAVANEFDVFRMWFLLPYLTMSLWTLKAAERNLRLFSR
jgi:hypothetical protein